MSILDKNVYMLFLFEIEANRPKEFFVISIFSKQKSALFDFLTGLCELMVRKESYVLCMTFIFT